MPRPQKPEPDRRISSALTEEITRFSALAPDWWDEAGPMRALHRMNPPRLSFIRDTLQTHFKLKPARLRPLDGLRILDLGCGGGILTEPLARMGASVTGVDAAAAAIRVARAHARTQNLKIDYRQAHAEDLAAAGERFDVVCALELIEHVADPKSFIQDMTQLVRPGGMAMLSTLNRTPKSMLLGIVAAEYILRWAPRGTHDWRKFLKPSELTRLLRDHACEVTDLSGIVFDPLAGCFRLSPRDLEINYILAAVKT